MKALRFSKLLLLSDKERRALIVPFHSQKTILQAPNGYGKSAVLKSLYATLGASPHKIDAAWKSANVTSILEFTIDGERYTAVSAAGLFGIFDSDDRVMIRTQSRTKELAPFLADLLDFRLVMTDRNEETVVPPPSYIFAPYYVDQDHGWLKPWTSFKDFYLPRSALALAEYHAGVKTNDFYKAQAERDRLAILARDLEFQQKSVGYAIAQIDIDDPDQAVFFDLGSFEADRERLISESNRLLDAQMKNRHSVSKYAEEAHLWHQQVVLLTGALAELDDEFADALSMPDGVECPTCGSHFHNSFVERFQLIEDKDSLISALVSGRQRFEESKARHERAKAELSAVEENIGVIREVLSISHEGVTLEDIISIHGKMEAVRHLRCKQVQLDEAYTEITRKIEHQVGLMKAASNPQRARGIRGDFNERMARACFELDVSVYDRRRQPLHSAGKTRGSEGVRELLAYYFSFFGVTETFGSGAFCPIVIDAPNQQGQDEKHLPQMMKFIIDQTPADRQLILGVEDATGISGDGVEIVSVGSTKRQVLVAEHYDEASETMRSFLTELLFGELPA